MKFSCKDIDIQDEWSSITLTLSGPDRYHPGETTDIDEITKSLGTYIMIQRSYPEDDFERDYYHYESSNFDDGGRFSHFQIDLYRDKFLMTLRQKVYDIALDTDSETFSRMKSAIERITNGRGTVNFHDKEFEDGTAAGNSAHCRQADRGSPS